MKHKTPNFALRDLAGLVCVSLLAAALVVVAFLTHAGPIILIAVLILLIFGLSRRFRERGRETEAQEATKALHTRLHKGEKLQAATVGDRRRVKPLGTLADMALLMFSQGLASGGSGAMAVDDTFVGLTDKRIIAIDQLKRPVGKKKDWRERLNLRRLESHGQHAIVFEAPREGLACSVRLSIFYLAALHVRAADGRTFSVGLNCRFWAKRAVALSRDNNKNIGPKQYFTRRT